MSDSATSSMVIGGNRRLGWSEAEPIGDAAGGRTVSGFHAGGRDEGQRLAEDEVGGDIFVVGGWRSASGESEDEANEKRGLGLQSMSSAVWADGLPILPRLLIEIQLDSGTAFQFYHIFFEFFLNNAKIYTFLKQMF